VLNASQPGPGERSDYRLRSKTEQAAHHSPGADIRIRVVNRVPALRSTSASLEAFPAGLDDDLWPWRFEGVARRADGLP